MNKRGFTLIELLIVIAILGLLSTIITVAMGNARLKARDSKRMSDLKQLQTALELYYNDHDSYPTETNVQLGTGNYACLSITGFGATGCGPALMANIPPGPLRDFYTYTGSTSTYSVRAVLEGSVQDVSGPIVLTPTGITNQ